MTNFYAIHTDGNILEIYYYKNSNTVYIKTIKDDGLEYLDTLLFSINNKVTKPDCVVVAGVPAHIKSIRDNSFIDSGLTINKIELYYSGNKNKVVNCLYEYFNDKDGVCPFDNQAFINMINLPHRTLSYRLDSLLV